MWSNILKKKNNNKMFLGIEPKYLSMRQFKEGNCTTNTNTSVGKG